MDPYYATNAVNNITEYEIKIRDVLYRYNVENE